MNKIILILFGIVIINGCSSDDTLPPEAIIGEWLTVGRQKKSGEPDELGFCENLIYRDCTPNGDVIAKWVEGEVPVECEELGLSRLQWEYVGNNTWEVGTSVLLLSIVRIEGNRMIEENLDNDWIYFYRKL